MAKKSTLRHDSGLRLRGSDSRRLTLSKVEASRSFFPQNFRKKTAKILNQVLKLCCLLLVACCLLLNLHASFFPENEILDRAKRMVLNDPFRSKVHESLVKVYLERGDLTSAERELWLAKHLFSPDQVSLKTLEQNLKKAKEKPNQIREEISFWEKVIEEKPDYRDAYFQLAVLNYQIGNDQKAKQWLAKVLSLDPNFEPAK